MRLISTILGASLLWTSALAAADNPANQSAPFPDKINSGNGLLAPDPPAARHSDTVRAAFEQDAAPLAATLAEKSKDFESAIPVRRDDKPQQPLRGRPETAEGANPVRPANNSPATRPASIAAQSAPAAPHAAFAAPLGLGSHNDKILAGKSSPLTVMITVGGSLAVVLGLFFVVAWAMRKTAPRGSLVLPREVFEILGRAPLGARQQVQLLRCGSKLLLVSIMPGGTETLTEVTDPLEVDRIAGICQQAHPKSATMAFRQVFQQLAPKSGPALIDDKTGPARDDIEPAGTRKKRYRWEENHA